MTQEYVGNFPVNTETVMVNFFLTKIFYGNLNGTILLAEIDSFRSPQKISLGRNTPERRI